MVEVCFSRWLPQSEMCLAHCWEIRNYAHKCACTHTHTHTHTQKAWAICRQLTIPVSIRHLKQHAVTLVKPNHAEISQLAVRSSGMSLESFVYLPALSIVNFPFAFICLHISHSLTVLAWWHVSFHFNVEEIFIKYSRISWKWSTVGLIRQVTWDYCIMNHLYHRINYLLRLCHGRQIQIYSLTGENQMIQNATCLHILRRQSWAGITDMWDCDVKELWPLQVTWNTGKCMCVEVTVSIRAWASSFFHILLNLLNIHFLTSSLHPDSMNILLGSLKLHIHTHTCGHTNLFAEPQEIPTDLWK